MWNFFNPFFLPFTIIFLIICGVGLLYLLLAISQFATGYREKNPVKKQGGLFALFISISILIAAIYFYFKWVWIG
jgi:hypothetical protein